MFTLQVLAVYQIVYRDGSELDPGGDQLVLPEPRLHLEVHRRVQCPRRTYNLCHIRLQEENLGKDKAQVRFVLPLCPIQ